ncbi:MAG TPA: HAD family hydrolase [Candidatus Tectomicrobia bacterium]|nr:HAD family hydrolase [Candidatus Tectomicrobia bacterium]
MTRLLVFDFDGLILDTETPALESWREIYAAHGHALDEDLWTTNIGTADVFDPCRHLVSLVGTAVDGASVLARRNARFAELVAAQPVLPGVREYLDAARERGLPLAVASSSDRAWVEGHLDRLGLRDRFQVVRTSDDVPRVKPDPALYRAVLDAAGVAAHEAVAFEDSPNGVRAAKAAGLTCVAVPNALTARLDLSEADLRLGSLAEMTLPRLLEMLRRPA